MSVELVGVGIENLRGFESANLDLQSELVVLVGPNNAGKTSVLRMLDWILNAPGETFDPDRRLDPGALDLLRPARNTRNKARRLTLKIYVQDGRRHHRFRCVRGVAQIRIGLRLSPYPSLRINLGPPKRGEGSLNPDALSLLQELRSETDFRLIPASRDASSPSFETRLSEALTTRLEERATHSGRAGAPREYRRMSGALKEVIDVAESLAGPLWDEMKAALPAGLAQRGLIKVDAEPADLVDWVASKLRFRLSTGAHDVLAVPPTEVGSGLQSLLELAIEQARGAPPDRNQILALEEPEAFLHPAAQRTLARRVFEEVPGMRLLSTHSPLLVEEARFGDVVLVHDHSFYAPAQQADERREAINTALLTRYGAEMVFAKSVLLVEGEGDREFFENLRRRVAPLDDTGAIDRLVVIPTGSKSFFAPWMELLSSYGTGRTAPIRWTALVDGDGAREIADALRIARVRVPSIVARSLAGLASANAQADLDARIKTAREVNRPGRLLSPVMISPGDLEWMTLASLPDATAVQIATRAGVACATGGDLARALGSKHCSSPHSDPVKSPWIRAVMGREIPWDELSSDTRLIFRRWLEGAMTRTKARSLISEASSANI